MDEFAARTERMREIRAILWGEGDAVGGSGHLPKELPSEEFLRLCGGWTFGEVWQRPFPDINTRVLLDIAIVTAMGLHNHLRTKIRIARHLGYSRQNIVDLLIHTAVHAGHAACLEAMATARKVFDDEDAAGGKDPASAEFDRL